MLNWDLNQIYILKILTNYTYYNKQAVKFVNNKTHLTIEGLNHIVNIKASMVRGLSDMLKTEFF